ncbi:MAG: transcription-repair coupling factor [Thermodesulfobacteriota bacterium]
MQGLLSEFAAGRNRQLTVTGLRGSALSLLASRLLETTRSPLVIVTAGEEQAVSVEGDLRFFTGAPTLFYPAYDIPPYTPLSPDPFTVADRIAALHELLNLNGAGCCVLPVDALLRRVPPKGALSGLAELIIAGEDTALDELTRLLVRSGYEPVSLVRNIGEFASRGGIIDIFAPGNDYPVRLDFFGDTVESIRFFDPVSQRSVERVEEFVLLPVTDLLLPEAGSAAMDKLLARADAAAKEHGWQERLWGPYREMLAAGQRFPGAEFYLPLFYESTSSLLDYFPRGTAVLIADGFNVDQMARLALERIGNNHDEARREGLPVLPPERLFLTDWRKRLEDFPTVIHQPLPVGDDTATQALTVVTGNHKLLKQELDLRRQQHGIVAHLAETVRDWLRAGDRVALACRSRKRTAMLQEMLAAHGLPLAVIDEPYYQKPAAAGHLCLYPQPLSEGFDLAGERLHLLSESELLGERRLGGRKKKASVPEEPPISFDELAQDDVVVHRQHGLGIYRGLVTMTLQGVTNDYLQIHYKDDDKLYVPVDRIHEVTKYKGIGDAVPALDKLGAKTWSRTREKVKKAVWKIAQELVELYARRQLVEGTASGPPDELYYAMEEAFPYEETPGQVKAIREVLEDLATPRPMDRLVCGDVGYGKTEVAVRAAFKVITDGRQVAMLVPTTVLAEQHLATFRERLAGMPVRIECLNRFRSRKEQQDIVAGLAAGAIDMVIGTHRLLSRDVSFRRLGLLIIDEEHRFGVKDKERIKRARTQVDVLTLTATPIPRTMQMSLLGIRDLSVISTPPARRRSVKTFIARHDDLVIKEAVRRELTRGGQVFLVHNRVQSIGSVAHKLQELVPEARIAVAHGQMAPRVLEEIMVKFVQRQVDVLVCTTIIESGLDIPNANTIIITRADRLGLAEIYQLRGRVGRGREQAYAYLLMPTLENLSKDAQRRLRALMDYNELGGGFKLAMSDLQIRGGGNILGESQSGTIAAVGYDLYLELLQKTIEDIKSGVLAGEDGGEPEIEPEVNLRLSAFIPQRYVGDADQRYFAYRRIATLATPEAIADMREELRDRFGPLPPETESLLAVIDLKLALRELRIEKLESGAGNTLVFTFHPSTPVTPEILFAFMKRHRCRLSPDSRLIVTHKEETSPMAAAKNVLQALRADARK